MAAGLVSTMARLRKGFEMSEKSLMQALSENGGLYADLERRTAELEAELAASQQRVAELEAALEPFAKTYDAFPLDLSLKAEEIFGANDASLYYRDFYRAHRALTGRRSWLKDTPSKDAD